MKNKRKLENGFTLVELLAVIVILAIILVIAVPKVMSIIEDAKMGTLESTAKMIANQAEKQKVQNTVLGNNKEIKCEDIVKINDVDYESCSIEFEDNTAKVTIVGSGKFEGLHVCDGTKTESIAQINECDFGGGSSLPEMGGEPDDYTWEEINAISKAGKADEYFDLGDTKTIDMGTYGKVVMEIVAFDADTKANGTGTAAITWISKDLIAEHVMKSGRTTAGGWKNSEMRSWLQTDVYNTLPSEVKSAIVEVNKTYGNYTGGSYPTYTTLTCVDKVWIPSMYEIFGSGDVDGCETSGATYISYFRNASRVKHYGGEAASWWLRTATNNYYFYYRNVSVGGVDTRNYTDFTFGVALGFCTG